MNLFSEGHIIGGNFAFQNFFGQKLLLQSITLPKLQTDLVVVGGGGRESIKGQPLSLVFYINYSPCVGS